MTIGTGIGAGATGAGAGASGTGAGAAGSGAGASGAGALGAGLTKTVRGACCTTGIGSWMVSAVDGAGAGTWASAVAGAWLLGTITLSPGLGR